MIAAQHHQHRFTIRHQHQGTAGRWTAQVIAVDVSPAEPWVVAFAADAACVAAPQGGTDTGTFVRQTISTSQLSQGLQDSGITLRVDGTSSNSARLYYYSNLGGTELSWTIVFYAATPNLGAVITQVTVRGINVTTRLLNYLGRKDLDRYRALIKELGLRR
jgi:hypothetical protein